MPQRNISYAEISVFTHATEDLEKVKSAVTNTMPNDIISSIVFTQTTMSGHYGNPIIELRVMIDDRRIAYEILRKIISELSSLDSTTLDGEFKNHLDSRNRFYIRLDKQQALLGKPVIALGDSISLMFRVSNYPKSLADLEASVVISERRGGEIDANI
jgi:RNA binding exosome subunit